MPDATGGSGLRGFRPYIIGITPALAAHTDAASGARGSFPPAKSAGIVHLAQKMRPLTKQRK